MRLLIALTFFLPFSVSAQDSTSHFKDYKFRLYNTNCICPPGGFKADSSMIGKSPYQFAKNQPQQPIKLDSLPGWFKDSVYKKEEEPLLP